MMTKLASIAKIMCVPRANDTRIIRQLGQDVDATRVKGGAICVNRA
jgi:hypothetical protein